MRSLLIQHSQCWYGLDTWMKIRSIKRIHSLCTALQRFVYIFGIRRMRLSQICHSIDIQGIVLKRVVEEWYLNEACNALSYRGIMEVQIFWILVIFYCIYWALRLFRTQERKIFMNSLLRLTVQLWVMISALLHRPYNVFLLPMQLIFSSIIDDALQTYDYSKDIRIYVSILMGNVFYFYQVFIKFSCFVVVCRDEK